MDAPHPRRNAEAPPRIPTSYDRLVGVAWAPGRVNLIGEHTDYSGGLVLPVAIQYGISVEVSGEAESVALRSEL